MCCVLSAGEVIQLKAPAGATFSIDELKAAVKQHKPAILFLVQVRHLRTSGDHQGLPLRTSWPRADVESVRPACWGPVPAIPLPSASVAALAPRHFTHNQQHPASKSSLVLSEAPVHMQHTCFAG